MPDLPTRVQCEICEGVMNCATHLWNAADGLRCLRTDDHATGHIYGSAWLPDVHDDYDPEDGR